MGKNDLKIIWVGRLRTEGKKIEKEAIEKYGDALLSSGPVIINGKEVFGYAVHVPIDLMNTNKRIGLGLFR